MEENSCLVGCLLISSRSRIFHSYRDVSIAVKGMQNLGLCSVFTACVGQGDVITMMMSSSAIKLVRKC